MGQVTGGDASAGYYPYARALRKDTGDPSPAVTLVSAVTDLRAFHTLGGVSPNFPMQLLRGDFTEIALNACNVCRRMVLYSTPLAQVDSARRRGESYNCRKCCFFSTVAPRPRRDGNQA